VAVAATTAVRGTLGVAAGLSHAAMSGFNLRRNERRLLVSLVASCYNESAGGISNVDAMCRGWRVEDGKELFMCSGTTRCCDIQFAV